MTLDQLKNIVNKLDEEKKVLFILNYFFKTVQYDYARLQAAGYGCETIKQLKCNDANPNEAEIFLEENFFPKKNVSLEINGETKQYSDKYSITFKVIEGTSNFYNNIVEIAKKTAGDIELFESEVKYYVKEELSKHLDNDVIIDREASIFVSTLISDITKPVCFLKGKYAISYGVFGTLIRYALSQNNFSTSIVNSNGILERGVCKDYTEYLVKLFNEIGIEAHSIVGISELEHEWICVKVNGIYKSVDLTRAIFIRDGFKNIPNDQKAEDWLLCDFKEIFKMQKTRIITEIDGRKLDTVINSNNYNEEEFINIINQKCRI